MLERKVSGLFTVSGFDDRKVSSELALDQLAQVAPLGYVVFGYENRHFTSRLPHLL
jgi:hypothetical protein